ncbi:MAG: hypothetical protein M3Q69_14540 [Acidobacteriota bacterium]|nr:hypothetical protein [Acidobacteriota bacterium]
MAETFRELHGDYVENVGQELSLREYLDYFEPLGSALARLPDGAGGPFVHHFTDSGGRTISALGWVVSAKSKRFGGWKLWGMWTAGPMPAVALPAFWPVLADPSRTSEWVSRANDNVELLVDEDRWSELLKTLKAPRLRDEPFRELLKAELARAYAVPLPHRHPLEIEVAPQTLDLLPWLYLLGPVDPSQARLQPNRFNGPGYQYILTDTIPSGSDVEIPREIDSIVDAAAKNVASGFRHAAEFRARRERPPVKPARPRERSEMRSTTSPSPPSRPTRPTPDIATIADAVWKLAVLLLLAWIAWNVHLLRKSAITQPAAPPAVETETTSTSSAPVTEPPPSESRVRRIASALQARPPRNVSVSAAALDDIQANDSEEKLARVAIEIFLRRNRCYTGTDAADARFSTAEQRAMRTCTSLTNARLMKDRTQPDAQRAIQWLQEIVGQ